MKPVQVWDAYLKISICAALLLLLGCMNLSPYAVTCIDSAPMQSSDRDSIRLTAMHILNQLAANQSSQVWADSYPQLKNSVTQEQFVKLSQDIQPRLRVLDQAQLVDARLIQFSGVVRQSVQVACGSVDPKSPDYLRVQAIAGPSRQAVALVEIPTEPLHYIANLQLAEDAGMFKLGSANINVNPTRYKGKDATGYAQSAEVWLAQGKPFLAYVDSEMAVFLSQLAPTLQSSQEIKFNGRFEEIGKIPQLQPELTSWRVKNTDYRIIRIGLTSTLDDIVPTVLYLSHQELTEKNISAEAASLMDYVRGEYPELGSEYLAVLFQAYSEIPSDPNRNYPYYRVPIFFQPQ